MRKSARSSSERNGLAKNPFAPNSYASRVSVSAENPVIKITGIPMVRLIKPRSSIPLIGLPGI